AFNGRSIPAVWDACISGVPPRALPKMMSPVGRSLRPASAAPAAWSMRAKTVIRFARTSASSRSIVSLGPTLLGIVVSFNGDSFIDLALDEGQQDCADLVGL